MEEIQLVHFNIRLMEPGAFTHNPPGRKKTHTYVAARKPRLDKKNHPRHFRTFFLAVFSQIFQGLSTFRRRFQTYQQKVFLSPCPRKLD